ncbi:anthranilate phosphoribosyltransferase [Halobacteriales archaeon QS_1_69_70]|nr:MAG: anthranilate phosphoribosyltransferase [Halobacteriales archaeon QS_1_69_70]
MIEYIDRVTSGEGLSRTTAREAGRALFNDATDTQLGAMIAGLRAKGETVDEVVGIAEGLSDSARMVRPDVFPLVTLGNTGSGEHGTFDVLTSAALVAVAADVQITRHLSGPVGSYAGRRPRLGVLIDEDPRAVSRAIEEVGIGLAPMSAFHTGMEAYDRLCAEVGLRTIFDILGPLINPTRADAQLVGVAAPELVEVVAHSLKMTGADRALVVHGDGLDQVAVHGPTVVAEVNGGDVHQYSLRPSDIGLEHHDAHDIATTADGWNMNAVRSVVTGREGEAKQEAVLANAGAIVYLAGAADTLCSGVEQARTTIESGRLTGSLNSSHERRISQRHRRDPASEEPGHVFISHEPGGMIGDNSSAQGRDTSAQAVSGSGLQGRLRPPSVPVGDRGECTPQIADGPARTSRTAQDEKPSWRPS